MYNPYFELFDVNVHVFKNVKRSVEVFAFCEYPVHVNNIFNYEDTNFGGKSYFNFYFRLICMFIFISPW